MNTRFNPTSNGHSEDGILHLGHAAIAYLNSEIAHKSGGKFVLRFDNNQSCWINILGKDEIDRNCAQMLLEMEWLGIDIDEVVYQSEEVRLVEKEMRRSGLSCSPYVVRDPIEGYAHVPTVTDSPLPQYPYAPWLTLEVVVSDFFSGIDTVILGKELLDRYSLYCFTCESLGYPIPKHYHVPHLRGNIPEAPNETHNGNPVISKTNGNYKIKEYHDKFGWSPYMFKSYIEQCYLVGDRCHRYEWAIENIKKDPVIL